MRPMIAVTSPSTARLHAIRAHAFLEARHAELAALRDAPLPAAAPPLPPRFLRHCDEHTVVAVRAVLATLAGLPVDLARCGVVAAPCQAGRIATARSLSQLQGGGAVMVSPHIVPQCSLHSLAGAISVALGMHGPHIGVGGGPEALAEGLFTALTLLEPGAASACDAIWLVATEWAAEPLLDPTGAPTGDPVCRAVALLLAPLAASDDAALHVTIHQPRAVVPAAADEARIDLQAFAAALDCCATGAALAGWTIACPWGGEIRVSARADRMPSAHAGRRLREAA